MKSVALLGAGLISLLAVSDSLALDDIVRQQIERRATEAVIWGMPAVNTDLMFQAFRKAGGGANQIALWSRLPSWKNQTLTPNPDTVYLIPFFDTKSTGPMVLEFPPADTGSITANIDNIWQVALEDAGPAGADKGAGGKYLILPPGYSKKVPAGYIPLRSDTFTGYALIRSTPKTGSEEDVAKAVAYGKRVKLYPLSTASKPQKTVFVDVVDDLFDATIPYDAAYFVSLDRVVQSEPWLQRDRAMIDPLKSLGIEKGKAFKPDGDVNEALSAGARAAQVWLEYQRQHIFVPYFENSRWFVPALPEGIQAQSDNFAKADSYTTDSRAITYSMGYVGIKHLGAGQFYIMSVRDKAGDLLDGTRRYRLAVPANAPARQYWSATVYDANTHGFIRNLERFSRASNTPGLKRNGDGSVDISFGPVAPPDGESNWIPTMTGQRFEVLFRLYGPEKPLFDKSWVLPDIEAVQ